jgi:hypothetical protein
MTGQTAYTEEALPNVFQEMADVSATMYELPQAERLGVLLAMVERLVDVDATLKDLIKAEMAELRTEGETSLRSGRHG